MMQQNSLPNGRRVIWVGGEELQIALAEGGGHIAGLRGAGIGEESNPYWQPPWPSFEPTAVTAEIVEASYGGPPEGRLLASILGHSLALDLYGPPSKAEEAAGSVTHGQIAVQPWRWHESKGGIVGECADSLSQLQFSRRVEVSGCCAVIEETVTNLCAWDRPICWQQHVSFGPPFCEAGFWASANCDRGTTHPQSFGTGARLRPNTETEWPRAPQINGDYRDYRQPLSSDEQANDFCGYRVRREHELGHFVVGNRRIGFALFYIWPRRFFPWLGIWDERHARVQKPWCTNVSVRAFEFGVSPYPDIRRNLLRRPRLFDVPTYLVLPAKETLRVRYALGIFAGIMEPADLTISGGKAALTGARGKLAEVDLHEMRASSVREEMSE